MILTVEFIEPMYAFAVSGRGRYLWTRVLIEPLVQLSFDLFARHQLQQRLTQDFGYQGRPCL